jgi:hypothetical protein
MNMYTVKLLDSDKCELASSEYDTLRDAKHGAKVAITEREYLEAGAHKVEVQNEHGICVWDRFARPADQAFVGEMSKTELINALAQRGYRSDGTSHYGKRSAWLIGPDGARGYYNLRDLLAELVAMDR